MSSDDEKTRSGSPLPPPTQEPVASVTAPDSSPAAGGATTSPNALGPGFDLREFEIERVIGEGGFSIVYLAIDRQLVRRIAIKEYMPSALALRTRDLTIVSKSERVRETFDAGLRSFVNEARLLAQFDHPSLVKVYRFWEERGTAYMVMPYYEGVTLSHWRRQHGPPDEAWLRRLLYSLLEALAQMHGQNCYHRDIAPDNILLLAGDHPVLLDLGAARHIIGDMTQALTVILKPGYAPVEQYAEVASMKQGAWTDLYALAAVLYFVVAGRAPPTAVARMVNDEMRPAREVGAGRYSEELLAAIDAALAVLPDKRPQSIDAFRALLGPDAIQLGTGATMMTGIQHPTSSPVIPGVTTVAPTPVTASQSWTTAPHTTPQRVTSQAPPAPTQSETATEPKRRPWRMIVSALAGVIVVAGIWLWSLPREAPPASDAKGTAATGTVQAERELSSHEMLLRLLDARSPSIEVRAVSSAASMRIGRDELRFAVATNVSGYVYVLLAGTDANHLYLLFPNASDNNNQITANATLLLPRPEWRVYAGGPPGVNRVLVLVSPRPRDFAPAGLRLSEPFSEFSQTALHAAIARNGPAALAGSAECIQGATNCDTAFGAAMFEVLEVEADGAPTAQKKSKRQ
jgi:serine/threonine protein kinase